MRLRPTRVVAAACERYDVAEADLVAARRRLGSLRAATRAAALALRRWTPLSLREIAGRLGLRDASAASHHIRMARAEARRDADFAAELDWIHDRAEDGAAGGAATGGLAAGPPSPDAVVRGLAWPADPGPVRY